jgi:hypothetical protein
MNGDQNETLYQKVWTSAIKSTIFTLSNHHIISN